MEDKAGGNILNLETVNLKPLLEDVLQELHLDIENNNLTVNYPKETTNIADWPDLVLDKSKIREALLIVIENAVKYNFPNGTIDITTDTKNRDGMFELTIANTGMGINAEDKNKIFNTLFYRGNDAKTVNPIGMGVGLSVARAIVQAHHGELMIESEGENKGARVKITVHT